MATANNHSSIQAHDAGSVGNTDYADYGTRNHRPYNRGKKLHGVVQQSNSMLPKLKSFMSINDEFHLSQIGKKRAIFNKVFKKELKDDLTSARHLIEDDPYLDVHIDEAWGIPEDMDQVGSVGSMVHTLRNRHLKGLSQLSLEMIEEECSFYRTLSQLGDILSGDDSFTNHIDFSQIPQDIMDDAKSQIQKELCSISHGYIDQLSQARGRVTSVYLRKKRLAKSLVPFD